MSWPSSTARPPTTPTERFCEPRREFLSDNTRQASGHLRMRPHGPASYYWVDTVRGHKMVTEWLIDAVPSDLDAAVLDDQALGALTPEPGRGRDARGRPGGVDERHCHSRRSQVVRARCRRP